MACTAWVRAWRRLFMNLRNLLSPTLSPMLTRCALCAMLALAAGCSSTGNGGNGGGSTSSSSSGESRSGGSSNNADPMANTERVVAQLDRDYVVGPTAAATMDMRVAWQYPGVSRTTLKAMVVRGDSAYTLDQQNFVTRIRLADGVKLWRTQVADPVLDVISLNVIDDRAYLTAGSLMLVMDSNNGTLQHKWNLEKVAGTQPVEFRDMLIYGSRGGDVIWLSRRVGFIADAYHVSPTIKVPLVIRENVVAAVGARGEIYVLNAESATQYWNKMLLNPVECRPVIGDDLLYVAATDQYLWAFDLRSGRTDWKALTEAPLTTSPTLIGDRLYQQIPGTGLACYNAMPIDLPGGERFWINDKVTGVVVYERRGNLFAWDPATKRMVILDAMRGLTQHKLDLPQVQFLFLGGEKREDIIVASNDGRVVRLTPRN